MKKPFSLFLAIFFSAMMVFSVFAEGTENPFDLHSMSIEELQALSEAINQEILSRTNPETEKHETKFEVHTFKNGYKISVTGVTVNEGRCTIHYSFSHQNEEPTYFDINDTVFQNGIELESDYTSADINSYMRNTLKDTTVDVTRTYILTDNSALTIYISPWFSDDKPYVVTLELPQT